MAGASPENNKTRYVTVLENSFINSPLKAVRSAIFKDAEKIKRHHENAALDIRSKSLNERKPSVG